MWSLRHTSSHTSRDSQPFVSDKGLLPLTSKGTTVVCVNSFLLCVRTVNKVLARIASPDWTPEVRIIIVLPPFVWLEPVGENNSQESPFPVSNDHLLSYKPHPVGLAAVSGLGRFWEKNIPYCYPYLLNVNNLGYLLRHWRLVKSKSSLAMIGQAIHVVWPAEMWIEVFLFIAWMCL